MRVYLSVDMEGVAGIVDWAQCLGGGEDYALGRDLLVGEVNAAIDGALAAGATHILVNDAHSVMRNLPPEVLHGRASYLSGRFKPLYMMQGLDETYQAAIFLGYHAAMATPGVLSHTYNPRAIANVRLGGVTTGEAGLNALVAQHFGVPIAVITGDQHVGPEAAPFCPGITAVEVKTSISRHAAQHLHPMAAREAIRDGVDNALGRLAGDAVVSAGGPSASAQAANFASASSEPANPLTAVPLPAGTASAGAASLGALSANRDSTDLASLSRASGSPLFGDPVPVGSAPAGHQRAGSPSIAMPATIEVEFLSPDMAEQATWIRGVTRLDGRTVALSDDDPLRLHQAFITLVYLTRSLVDQH